MLRVTAPVSFGEAMIAPRLMQFLEQHPRVQADLHFSDDRVNIIAEGFDVAIRMGTLVDSEMISRRLPDISMVIVAAPSYLAAHGNLENVRDLKRHTAILTRKHLDHWDIDGESVRVSWRINTGNAAVTRDAVRAGLGIARVPEFFVAQDLANGALARVLPNYTLPTYPVAAVYPRSTVPSLALRTLLDDLPRWCG